eukprot:1048571-Amphidinium_carterae.3
MNTIVNVCHIRGGNDVPELTMWAMHEASMRLLNNAIIKNAEDQGTQRVALDQAMLRAEAGRGKLVPGNVNGMLRHQVLDELTVRNRGSLQHRMNRLGSVQTVHRAKCIAYVKLARHHARIGLKLL